MGDQDSIRNFCIIAHIDTGKSTLADRLLELTDTVPKEKLTPQFLDQNPIERERGITIKLVPVRMNYTLDATNYTLNLIDTPGHVDFSYEVSRTLAAVEGAILLIDGTQGVQAQTLSHGIAAMELGLTLIPAINKIDLSNVDINRTKKDIVNAFGFKDEEILLISAKTGEGVRSLLNAVIERVPSPKTGLAKLFRALIFDCFYDSHKGVTAQVRVVDGELSTNDKIHFLATGAVGTALEVGYFLPQLVRQKKLINGEIGYIVTGIKEPEKVRVGDTVVSTSIIPPLPGYKNVKPMVYLSLFPIDQKEIGKLKVVLTKFRLNDPAITFVPESSKSLGTGLRCGFLGMLHAEIVQERIYREYDIDTITAAPSVEYLINGKTLNNPAELEQDTQNIKEPWVTLKIFVPRQFMGGVMDLVTNKRGVYKNMQHFGSQVELFCEMPMLEMITDFYDKLKSATSGFASLDWEFLEFREVDAVRVDILVAGEKVDALSTIVVREKAESASRRMVEKLKEVLPRQNFEVAIQAAISGKVIARETLPALRKDVTAKLYGGDVTRKMKLLEKQKKGKKKMKMIGKVEIPQEAFLSILKI